MGVEGAERLENEGRNAFHAGQHRGGGVEQGPVAEIAMRAGHEHRPCRLRGREDANQPATVTDDGTRLVTLGNVFSVVAP